MRNGLLETQPRPRPSPCELQFDIADIRRVPIRRKPASRFRQSSMPLPHKTQVSSGSRRANPLSVRSARRNEPTRRLNLIKEDERMPQPVVDKSRPDLGGNLRHGDICTHCPVLWRFLVERFAITSVLDVGCGEGHAVSFFRRLGCVAHGIDGLRINIDRAVTPIALHDLTRSSYIMPVDLVWSCEVAEHLPDENIDFFTDTLANGRVVAMTHAVPGQSGHHHVNCQPPEYWIQKMAARGFTLDSQNEEYRKIARSDLIFNYFTSSGLIFHRN